MQKWEKLNVISLSQNSSSGPEFASLPFGEFIDNNLLKVYFSNRDEQGRSVTKAAIIDVADDFRVLEQNPVPVLCPGDAGFFDDAGAMGSCLVNTDERDLMFYVGWNLTTTVPFRNALGLAIREKGSNSFVKASKGPILDRSRFDPSFVAGCDVICHQGQFLMYYLSCDGWRKQKGELQHRYNIKIAKSQNCQDWHRDGHIAIDYRDDAEYALSSPRVLVCEDRWRMWFSYRGDSYKIGYAESDNGMDWHRDDTQMAIFCSPIANGFDGEMQCYPFLFFYQDRIMMLYNGNGYGRTGIGVAVLQE